MNQDSDQSQDYFLLLHIKCSIFLAQITIQAKNLYFLLNGRLRTTEEQSGSGSLNSSVDYGRGKSVGFVEAYQVGTRDRDTVDKNFF